MNTSYVCVECGASVPHLVRDYGKGNVRLAICNHCNAIADKYVEYEHVLLFLDVMLFKPQVYRHILYNLPSPPSFVRDYFIDIFTTDNVFDLAHDIQIIYHSCDARYEYKSISH